MMVVQNLKYNSNIINRKNNKNDLILKQRPAPAIIQLHSQINSHSKKARVATADGSIITNKSLVCVMNNK